MLAVSTNSGPNLAASGSDCSAGSSALDDRVGRQRNRSKSLQRLRRLYGLVAEASVARDIWARVASCGVR